MNEHETYLESLRYSNKRMVELVDRIQGTYPPDKQPIIVIQSDEGPGPVGWNPNSKAHARSQGHGTVSEHLTGQHVELPTRCAFKGMRRQETTDKAFTEAVSARIERVSPLRRGFVVI